MIKAPFWPHCSLLFLVAFTIFQSSETEAADVTIRAFEVRDDQYIPVTGEITGSNSVTLFFSASVQGGPSSLVIEAPFLPFPLTGSSGGASVQVFDSGTVAVSYYTNWYSGPTDVPVTTTNFMVRLLDPLILSLSLQDRVGKRNFAGTNDLVEAADFAEISLSSKYIRGLIYYTTDGTEPSLLSHRYFGPLKVTRDTDFRAIAYNVDFTRAQQRRVQVHIVPSVYLRILNTENVSVQVPDRPDAQLSYSTIFVPSNSVVRLQNTNAPFGGEFVGWIGFTNSTNSQIDIVLNRNREIVQNVRYTNKEPIQVELSKNGTVIQGEKFKAFTSILDPRIPGVGLIPDFRQITAVPDPGYFFVGYQNSTAAISYPQVLTSARVHPLFAPLPPGYHSLTLEGKGLVIFSPIEHYAIADGADVVITATGQPGFVFTEWSGDVSGTNPTIRVKMDRDKRLVAHTRQIFSRSTYSGSTSPVAVGESGLIYSSGGGVLRAFNSLGTVEWEVPFAPFVPSPPPGSDALPQLTYPVLGSGERIYVGAETATWALDKTGRILWQAPTGAFRLATSSNGVYTLSTFGELARLSFAGAVLARTNLNAYIRAFGITPEGNILVSGEAGIDSILRCFNDSFQELWHYPVAPQSLVIRKDGLILAAGWQTDLLDAAGKVLWSKTNAEPYNVYTVAAAASTNLFFVYEASRAFPYNVSLSAFAEDGSSRWTRPVEGLGSAVALEDSSVLSATPSSPGATLRRFGAGGETVWETAVPVVRGFDFSASWPTPNIVLDGKGNLYMPANSILVMAIDGSPANSGWPMWFGDWRNTGHSEPLPGSVVPSELGLFLSLDRDNLELFVLAPPATDWTLQSSRNLVNWADISIQTNRLELPASLEKNQFFRLLRK
jgi:hypothetical protein